MASTGTPVVFIHGFWLHTLSWSGWVDLFTEAGYDAVAAAWPGEPETVEAARAQPDAVGSYGLAEITGHFAAIIASYPTKPVVVGHSFGGLIAQNLLGRGLVSAAVAIDAAPISAVPSLPGSSLRAAGIALKDKANRERAVALTEEEFHYGFGNALSPEESARLFHQWSIPSPGRPLFEAALAEFSPRTPRAVEPHRADHGPLLLLAGGKDHAVPASVVEDEARLYRRSAAVTDYHPFPDRGHSLTIDHGWREVAQDALDWLSRQGL